jgi:hypothetical protein
LPHYDPIYGELLTSREVSELSGFTMNQLRNHRTRPEISPFPFVRQGGTSWYRKDDIALWLEDNGSVEYQYIRVPNAKSAPLRNTTIDAERKGHLDELTKITTRNAWSKWYTWFTESAGWKDPYGDTRKWQNELWKLSTGEELDTIYPKSAFHKMRNDDPQRYWPSFTYAMRKAVAQVRGYDITDEEIIEIPVGEVPPSKLD